MHSDADESRGSRHTRDSAEAIISETAAAWLARSDRGLTVAEKAELESWLSRDPRHAAEFERMRGAWSGMDGLDCFASLRAMADEVVLEAAARKRRQTAFTRHLLPSLGLAAALALSFAAWAWHGTREPAAETTRHQVLASTLRRIVLPDGSLADLNGDSRIDTVYTPTERRVMLLSGEAHFTVAKNPERPFLVTAGSVTVRAVGTAFNVRLQSERIEVLVTEGKVKLAGAGEPVEPSASIAKAQPNADASALPHALEMPVPPQRQPDAPAESGPALTAGQRAVIERPGHAAPQLAIATLAPAEIEEVLAWQSTRLVFNNTPLDEVVTAFNKHNDRRLKLGDPSLAERRITGVFRSDNLDGFMRLAHAIVDVRAETPSPSEIVFWPAP